MTVLEQHLDEYLQLRRTLGHKLADAHRVLPWFVTYLGQRDIEFVTIETALAWSLERDVPDGSVVPAMRMMAVRGFARYLSAIDPRTEVPPAGTIRRPRRWRRPFIYTDTDVLAMIEQARLGSMKHEARTESASSSDSAATNGRRFCLLHRPEYDAQYLVDASQADRSVEARCVGSAAPARATTPTSARKWSDQR
jgi:integrase/recombinase XerD